MTAKHITSLMKYLSEEKGIAIKGPSQRRKLRNMGYYHGYKGYRFFRSPDRQLPYKSFNELTEVYEYDMDMKTLFYPQIMFLETALKNYALEISLKTCDSERFEDFYDNVLNRHEEFNQNSQEYKSLSAKRRRLHSRIYHNLTTDYSNNPIISHFCKKGKPVPIWAIFEIIGLSDLGNLLACTNTQTLLKLSQSIGFNNSFDRRAELAEDVIYAVKDLRNAVAHNDAIFDIRFQEYRIDSDLPRYLRKELNIDSIDFNRLDDYVILIAYMMLCFGKSKTEIRSFVSRFAHKCVSLQVKIQPEIFETIVGEDVFEKIQSFYEYLFEYSAKG